MVYVNSGTDIKHTRLSNTLSGSERISVKYIKKNIR